LKLFLSYASPDKRVAEAIQFALLGAGHQVFFDEASLPLGGDYNSRIREAICESDVFIFLISPNSVSPGRYVQTELQLAKTKWPKPWGVVLPVMIAPTEHKLIDPYLAAVTILEPHGSAPAEVAAAVLRLRTSPDTSELKPRTRKPPRKSYDRKIVVFIALAVVIVGGAILLFRQELAKSRSDYSSSDAAYDVKYSGTAHWRKEGVREALETRFDLNLRIEGADVTGKYSDATGDKGELRLKIDGNSLVGIIVSDEYGGMCPWRGTLSRDGFKLDATYHCPDGERGELHLVRK
jgi:hypothetical protein